MAPSQLLVSSLWRSDAFFQPALLTMEEDIKVCCKYVSMDGIHMAPAPASAVLWVRDNELSDKPTLDAWKDDLYVLAKYEYALLVLPNTFAAQKQSKDLLHQLQFYCTVELEIQVIFYVHPLDALRIIARIPVQAARVSKAKTGVGASRTDSETESLVKTLSCVPGVGEKTALDIFKKFQTLQRVSECSQEELIKRAGLNPNVATKVWSFFNTSNIGDRG